MGETCYSFVAQAGSEASGEIFIKAAKKEGICVTVDYAPGKRTTKLLRSGKYVGEVGRIASYKEIIGDKAFILEPALASGEGVAISSTISEKSKLQNYSGQVGICRGWKWMSELVAQNKMTNIFEAKDFDQLINALNHRRIDLFFAPLPLINFSKILVKYEVIPIYEIKVFVWLHHERKDLSTKFSRVLESLYQK